jgi:hypothetical protein
MELYATEISGDTAVLHWSAVANALEYTVEIRLRDGGEWETYTTADNFLRVEGLLVDEEYDWQVGAVCETKLSEVSELCGFIAGDEGSGDCAPEVAPEPTCEDGKQNQGEEGIDCGGPCSLCPGCYVPTGLYADEIESRRVRLNWQGTEWDSVYRVRIRVVGQDNWFNFQTGLREITIRGLSRDTDYEWQVQSGCGEDESEWSAACTFNSSNPDSGNCTEEEAVEPEVQSCRDGIQNQGEEGIDCGGPCGDCATCQVDIPQGLRAQVGANSTALLEWETVQNAIQYTLRIRLSEHSDWEVYETAATSFGVAELNIYRAYQWQVASVCTENNSDWSEVCGFIAGDPDTGDCSREEQPSCMDGIQNQGETAIDCGGPCSVCEDEEQQEATCPLPETMRAEVRTLGSLNLVVFDWAAVMEAEGYAVRIRRPALQEDWSHYPSTRTSLILPRLPNGDYEWQLRSLCSDETGSWSAVQTFTLDNPLLSSVVSVESFLPIGVYIYPNPAQEQLFIQLEGISEKATQIRMFNFLGQPVQEITIEAGAADHSLQVDQLPRGVYFIQLQGQEKLYRVVLQ